MNNSYVIGRHGSFQLRYGWLTKGVKAVQGSSKKVSEIFSAENATINLGVGKNMVASIQYWLKAAKIIDNNGITDFGSLLIERYDTYLEDDASLWLIHFVLSKNKSFATSIYWLFNHFFKSDFTAEEAGDAFVSYAKKNNWKVAEKSLIKDLSVILRMYAPHKSDKTLVEDMLESPLSLLGLLSYNDGKYSFTYSSREFIPTEIFAYMINVTFADSMVVPVKELFNGVKNLSQVLKINEDGLMSHLEKLATKYPSYYQLREDAGINNIHREIFQDNNAYLSEYYEKN